MAKLALVLQDGFKDDHVVVSLSGKEIYRSEKVSTLLLRGYAAQIPIHLPVCSIPLRVEVTTRGIATAFLLGIQGDTTAVLSLQGHRILLQAQPGTPD